MIPAGEKRDEDKSIRFKLPLSGNGCGDQPMQPTTKSKLISNQYYISVDVGAEAWRCCRYESPYISLNLNVRNKDAEILSWSNQPSNWNPQVTSITSF